MESPSSGVRKLAAEQGDGESVESVVLQCASSEDVEDGEEVVCGVGLGEKGLRGVRSLSATLQAYCDGLNLKGGAVKAEKVLRGMHEVVGKGGSIEMAKSEPKENESGSGCSAADDVLSLSDDVGGGPMNQSIGGRKGALLRMVELRGHRKGDVRKRRYRARRNTKDGLLGVGLEPGEPFSVRRMSTKRKLQDSSVPSPVPKADNYEHTDSDESTSSSDSESSCGESEQGKRRTTNHKRRKGEADTDGSTRWTDESEKVLKTYSKDVWYDGSSKALQSRSEAAGPMNLHLSLKCPGSVSSLEQHGVLDCNIELKEMQQLLELQLQASERREAGMKHRMELMMELLTKHMGHVEKRVSNLEDGRRPHEHLLERINKKLEKVMDGFTVLNENLAILSTCISKKLDSQ